MPASPQSGESPRAHQAFSGRRALVLGALVGSATALMIAGASIGFAAAQPLPEPTLASSGPQTLDMQLPTLAADAREFAIEIDITGYQAELDACHWVRMDLASTAPIVGAHNYCGGDIILGMQPGDTVELVGEDLDGTYLVTESRDAKAGDSSIEATAGLDAEVILQTCYWGLDGAVRLVGLVPAP